MQRFVNNCTAVLAADFSNKFLSTLPYNPHSGSLRDYLGNNGILMSMCEGACDDDEFQMDHLSGSWLQNSSTGLRVFENEGVGMIIDPLLVNVECVYPVDGMTVDRDGMGCGPLKDQDDRYGPRQPAWLMRLWVKWRKITKFGYSKKWEDIPCTEFFQGDFPPFDDITMLMDHNNTWTTSSYVYVQQVEDIVGHTICYNDMTPTFSDLDMMLVYSGPDPWLPPQWQNCTDEMRKIVQENPKSRGIWNEVVIDNPTDLGQVVQALFYINPDNRENAYFEAERLGQRTVFELDPSDLSHAFQCPLDLSLDRHAFESVL